MNKSNNEFNLKYIHFENEKWRFKGRRANVIDAVSGLLDRKDSPEMLASDLDIPVEAVIEAIEFYNNNPETVKSRIQKSHKYADDSHIKGSGVIKRT